MKFCERCGEEIYTKDGENVCAKCEDLDLSSKRSKANKRASALRRAREDALRSCGLVKVRGAMGGTYWE